MTITSVINMLSANLSAEEILEADDQEVPSREEERQTKYREEVFNPSEGY